jgi:prepilin-type N-terminal cleavage/methylation domain-containing protein/prepilin-type processing-associated H-X9-DG protein
MTRRGLTLIELLIVIAIICIIAAILFPVFVKAREDSRAAQCSSNLKQLGIALIQYNQDYDELEPCGIDQYDRMNGWASEIYSYVKSSAVYICPDDPTPNAGASYGVNAQLGGKDGGIGHAPAPIQLNQLADPSKTVMYFEVQNDQFFDPSVQGINSSNGDWYSATFAKDASGYGTGGDTETGNDPNGQNSQNGVTSIVGQPGVLQYATGKMLNSIGNNFTALTGRHRGGSNFEFCDGHVRWLRGTSVSAGYAVNWGQTDFCGQSTPSAVAAEVACPNNKIVATFSTK